MARRDQSEVKPAPFLRWAGGKSKIVHLLVTLVPPKGSYVRYIEPFLGSGALFFSIQPPQAILGDLNAYLINCYQQVAADPAGVWRLLQYHMANHSKEYYYRIRGLDLNDGTPLERAARFIYINKTAFNGIFRVNRAGKFNVPYGPSSSGPALPTEHKLLTVARALKSAQLVAAPFEETCARAQPGDFIYLDPPYPPLGKSANFTHYTSDRFGMADQKRVAEAFKELDTRGCLVMLSNSDQPAIRQLFEGFNMVTLSVTRWLVSNGNRFKVSELVITNYPLLVTHCQQPGSEVGCA